MSQPSKSPRKKKLPANITELPDDEAIVKLFPKKLIREINREIGHEPASGPLKKKST